MSIKAALGKLILSVSVEELVASQITLNNFKILDIDFRHAARVEHLPIHHSDPFDRLLVVQAQTNQLTLISKDAAFRPYDIKVLW